jgi:hypothetical protein
MQERDWNIVVGRNPQGYIELNDGKEVVYGPIESVRVDGGDDVEVKVRWAIKRPINEFGIPTRGGKWEVVSNEPTILVAFPNFVVPFEIDNTPEKGPRARFGLNIIYFDDVQKVDPSTVEGLKLAN